MGTCSTCDGRGSFRKGCTLPWALLRSSDLTLGQLMVIWLLTAGGHVVDTLSFFQHYFWAVYQPPALAKCNSSPWEQCCGTLQALCSINRVHRPRYQFICLCGKRLGHWCQFNPIRMGRLFCEGPGSANRKYFSCTKRMTITRRASVTKAKAGSNQPVSAELDFAVFLDVWTMDAEVKACHRVAFVKNQVASLFMLNL